MVDIQIAEETAELGGEVPVSLSSIESDAIGEILNISMGSAATAIATMLGREVSITTPIVNIVKDINIEIESFNPSVGVEIEYIEGLSGSNFMVLKRNDVKAIVSLLLEGMDEPDGEDFSELQISAVGEIMNQMMGASSTAMASFFGKSINISTPKRFDPANMSEIIKKSSGSEYVVAVKFLLKVEGILNSDFVTIMPIDFTKELVANALNFGDEPEAEPKAESKAEPETKPETEPKAELETKTKAEPKAQEPKMQQKTKEKEVQQKVQAPPPVQQRKEQQHKKEMSIEGSLLSEKSKKEQPVSVQMLQLESFDDEEDNNEDFFENQDNFELILNVPLDVCVVLGRSKMPVKSVLDIRQGSLVELDKQAGEPVDVIVNGKLIARGDVVIIDDNFGVRITEILSSNEISKKING